MSLRLMRDHWLYAIILFAFIFLTFPFSYHQTLQAQAEQDETGSVSGFVTDGTTGETLLTANVALAGTNRGATTNNSGYYSISRVPPGDYTLVCSYVGYGRFEKDISIEAGEELRVDIELQPENQQLDEVVVESEEQKREAKNIGVSNVETELIKKVPSVLQEDVFRSVQLLPGVKASSDFSSGLYIRGGSPDQTLILLDRTTVYNPTHFFGFFSTFNPDAIKDVQLYKGGYPAEYGGRLGSVLSIYNKDGNRKEFEGTASVGLLSSRLSVEGPIENGSYMLSLRRSTLEPALAVLQNQVDNVPDQFYFLDANGKLNYDFNSSNKFHLAFYSGLDNVNFSFGEDANINLNYGNQTLSSTWTHLFNDKLFANFTLTGSRYFNYPSITLGGTPIEESNNIYDFSAKGDIEYFAGEKHQIKTGFWGGLLTLKYKSEFDEQSTMSSRTQTGYSSVYIQDVWEPTDRWEINGGIRFNWFEKGEFTQLAPRLSVEYQAHEDIRLQAAYGRYNQFLTQINTESFQSSDLWLTADDGVSPMYGDQYIVGAKTSPLENFGADIEVYYRTMKDLFELDPFVQNTAGLDYAEMFRFGEGYSYGLETMVERTAGRLNGQLSYTYSVTRRKFPQFNSPINQPRQARYYPPQYDRTHDITLILNYQMSQRWRATSVFSYATGQAYTKPLGRTQTVGNPFNSEPLDVLAVGKVNAGRLPAYHRLDLSFTRQGSFFDIAEGEWKFQIINAYSRRNVWFYNYNFDENPVEREKVQLLPILPSVSYTVNF